MEADAIFRRGMMLVLSSPSGAGKTTLSRLLLERESGLQLSVSVTTRPPRPGEIDGVDYHFVSQERFDALRDAGGLLEYATVFGNCYGTPREPVETALGEGRDILFDIDWQGTRQLVARAPDDVVSVFILPPSRRALEERLNGRGGDPPDIVARRMAGAANEIRHWDEYRYVVINDDLERALADISAILKAERLVRTRNPGLSRFVGTLLD
jgi:guanylate kinase